MNAAKPTSIDKCPYCGVDMYVDPSDADALVCPKCRKTFDRNDLEKMLLILSTAWSVEEPAFEEDPHRRASRVGRQPSNEPIEGDTPFNPVSDRKRPVGKSDRKSSRPAREQKPAPEPAKTDGPVSMVGQFDEWRAERAQENPDSFFAKQAPGHAYETIATTMKIPMFVADLFLAANGKAPKESVKEAGFSLLGSITGWDMFSDDDPAPAANNRNTGNRAAGNRAAGNRAAGNRAAGNRAANNRTGGNRAGGNRAAGNRAANNRTGGNRAGGNRTSGTRPSGDRNPRNPRNR